MQWFIWWSHEFVNQISSLSSALSKSSIISSMGMVVATYFFLFLSGEVLIYSFSARLAPIC